MVRQFQRDVFLPNYMIPAREFGALAPHSMTFDDLEVRHFLSYRLEKQ